MPHRSLPLKAARLLLPPLAAAAFLPSCAYMQTHKNVRELGRSYKGYQLEKPGRLYRYQGTWYMAATPATFRLHHDPVHDKVFRQTGKPTLQLQESSPGQPAFHAISDSTASVLLRPDGYADTATLARELATPSPSTWLSILPAATAHEVRAEVVGEPTAITFEPEPADIPLGYRLLSGLDLLVVDVPGTVVYNVAVPFIAPFVFFYEFISD